VVEGWIDPLGEYVFHLRDVWFDAGHQSIGPDLLIPFYEAMIAFAHRVLDQRRQPPA